MLPSPDIKTKDPKRERYTPLSIESDMTYGEENSSSKDDDNGVSLMPTVKFTPVELAVVAFIALISMV